MHYISVSGLQLTVIKTLQMYTAWEMFITLKILHSAAV